MTQIALFDVVIPGVIAWVLVEDLMRSVKVSERFRPLVNKLIENKVVISDTASTIKEPCSVTS
jgi:hypothetical protein